MELEEYDITSESSYEFEYLVRDRHLQQIGGQYTRPEGGLMGGKFFEASITNNIGDVQIYATLDGEEFFRTECGRFIPIGNVITAWAYQDHWAIQAICYDKFDIFQDGISLNTSKNYQSSFGFQVLGGLPFYLFMRNEQVGLSYDGSEVMLGYDSVSIQYCCEPSHLPPRHYENMIAFSAKKGDATYYVAIGLFGNP